MDSHKVWAIVAVALAVILIGFLVLYSVPSTRQALFGKVVYSDGLAYNGDLKLPGGGSSGTDLPIEGYEWEGGDSGLEDQSADYDPTGSDELCTNGRDDDGDNRADCSDREDCEEGDGDCGVGKNYAVQSGEVITDVKLSWEMCSGDWESQNYANVKVGKSSYKSLRLCLKTANVDAADTVITDLRPRSGEEQAIKDRCKAYDNFKGLASVFLGEGFDDPTYLLCSYSEDVSEANNFIVNAVFKWNDCAEGWFSAGHNDLYNFDTKKELHVCVKTSTMYGLAGETECSDDSECPECETCDVCETCPDRLGDSDDEDSLVCDNDLFDVIDNYGEDIVECFGG